MIKFAGVVLKRWIWMGCTKRNYPLFSHKKFYHTQFLTIFYFIFIKWLRLKAIFLTPNLNHLKLLYQGQYPRSQSLNPCLIGRKKTNPNK